MIGMKRDSSTAIAAVAREEASVLRRYSTLSSR